MIYIDITEWIRTRSGTGIQRVIKEFLLALIKNNKLTKYSIIVYDYERNHYYIISEQELKDFLNDVKNYSFKNLENILKLSDLKENSVFFDMDSVWNVQLKRSYLYKILKKQNIYIVNFIYDIAPTLYPQNSDKNTLRNFLIFLSSVYSYSDLIIFDSRSAEKTFFELKEQLEIKRDISSRVVKLGGDLSKVNLNEQISSLDYLLSKRYILFVGTIEPRKEQELVLDTYERLVLKYPDLNLVFVGKQGWSSERLSNKIKNHNLYNKSLYWLENLNDNELSTLYQNAFLVTYLSKHEGYGLPIAESLHHKNITITSKNSSMYEVAGNFADYVEYNTINELFSIIDLYLLDEELYKLKKDYIKDFYKEHTWEMMSKSLISVFDNFEKSLLLKTSHIEKLQFVFISIDVENIKGTIKSIDKYINFVKEYIIVTRKDMIDGFEKIYSQYSIKVIDENTILGKYSTDFSKRDHVSKNWILRASLLNIDFLDDEFIMLDDDNRPITNIDLTYYINNGKYSCYYFEDLFNWNHRNTEYDIGQKYNLEYLTSKSYELLQYSSHMPQIINKKIFKEVVNEFFDLGLSKPIDEWSTYFNYANSKYPMLFNKKQFQVMNWPERSSSWEHSYLIKEYRFENYYKTVYETGIFKDIDEFNQNKKIELKWKERKPYDDAKQYLEETKVLCSKNNMIHGNIKFLKNKKKLYFFNIPYIISSVYGAWIRIKLNYKLINIASNDNVSIYYTLDGRKGHVTQIKRIEDISYQEGILEIPISTTSIQSGIYNIKFNLILNNEILYDITNSLIKLLVCEQKINLENNLISYKEKNKK